MKCIILIAASSFLIAGCTHTPTTTRQADQWEYKIVKLQFPTGQAPEASMEAKTTLMNDLGKEGWEAFFKEEGGTVYFKRLKRQP